MLSGAPQISLNLHWWLVLWWASTTSVYDLCLWCAWFGGNFSYDLWCYVSSNASVDQWFMIMIYHRFYARFSNSFRHWWSRNVGESIPPDEKPGSGDTGIRARSVTFVGGRWCSRSARRKLPNISWNRRLNKRMRESLLKRRSRRTNKNFRQ